MPYKAYHVSLSFRQLCNNGNHQIITIYWPVNLSCASVIRLASTAWRCKLWLQPGVAMYIDLPAPVPKSVNTNWIQWGYFPITDSVMKMVPRVLERPLFYSTSTLMGSLRPIDFELFEKMCGWGFVSLCPWAILVLCPLSLSSFSLVSLVPQNPKNPKLSVPLLF